MLIRYKVCTIGTVRKTFYAAGKTENIKSQDSKHNILLGCDIIEKKELIVRRSCDSIQHQIKEIKIQNYFLFTSVFHAFNKTITPLAFAGHGIKQVRTVIENFVVVMANKLIEYYPRVEFTDVPVPRQNLETGLRRKDELFEIVFMSYKQQLLTNE